MTNQEKGSAFEIITKDFFVWLFEKIGFVVTQARVQKSGTQNGFDILIIISKDYSERRIFIECKNYDSDLSIGNIFKKGLNLESNYKLGISDLFIAINPKSNFSNEDNSEKLSPVLQSKFPFNYYALEKSNGVRELFALNKVFYKLIYGEEVNFEVNEEKEISKFKTILFSRKPFQKVIISDNDKEDFIDNIENEPDYIARFMSNDFERENSFNWNLREASLNLLEIVNAEDKIFILGNPGLGKSTELKKLALDFWKEGEVEGFVPIFRNLKNFTNTDDLYNFLPSNWSKLNNILLILDGIDELSDIEYFKSKLENFISKEKTEKQIKYVISCRTNIYESVVVNISGFKIFYLKNLTLEESLKLVEQRCGHPIVQEEIATKFLDYLKTPFHVQIFASYINYNNSLPRNIAELWNNYIENRLSKDKKDKLKKAVINIPLIKKYSRTISLVNELMKNNSFTEDNLFSIVKEDSSKYDEFLKNPLLEKEPSSANWFFEHRNIQEYFAALVISELPFAQIIDFIQIERTTRTHPSLFNTITFLINLLDKNSVKFKQLIRWLIENQIEILFKADSDRTDLFKAKVFTDYFKSQCLDKNLWISTDRTFSVKEIAEFGDCQENLDYLLDIFKETKDQPRVVISALNLLSFFTIPFEREDEVKDFFIDLLNDLSIQNSIKSKVINCITAHNFCVQDRKYLNTIFEIFKVETNKEINSSLLFMLRDIASIDMFFWYLREEFLRVNNIVERADIDKVHRSNSWVLEELVLKIADSDNFIELIAYYFVDGFNMSLNNSYAIQILERCLFFSSEEDDFIERFLLSIKGKTNYYLQEKLIVEIIVKSSKQYEASRSLLDNNDFSKVRMLLASIATNITIEMVKERFLLELIKTDEIEVFRNNLWFYNKGISCEFDKLMLSIGFVFRTPLLSEEELSDQLIQNNEKFQSNFDIIFNKVELLKEIEIIFQENTVVLDQDAVRKIESDWYKKNGYWSYTIDTSLKLLLILVNNYKESLTFKEVQILLENDFIRYDKIKSLIQGNVNSNIRFKVSDEQIKDIIEWCIKVSFEINFEEIIILYDFNSFNYGRDYEKLKTVLIFQDEYEFKLSQEFLLNCLEYFDIDKSSENEDIFEKLALRINDEKLFNERIINNIQNRKMFSFVMDRHVSYALDNQLLLAFPAIRKYLKDITPGYNLDEKLEKYTKLTRDVILLKECCEDVKSPKCWSSIKILLKNHKQKDFCINKALEYLEIKREDNKNFYLWDALGVLFQENRKEAIVYYHSLLKEDGMSQMYYSNYSCVDYITFENIFFKTYGKNSDKNVFNDSGAFLTAYISNLSKADEGYYETQKVLKLIKMKLNKEEHDSELFYINILIDNSTTSYINSKSMPMNFVEALRKVEEIIN